MTTATRLPSVPEYFNRIVAPRFPALGRFRGGTSPGKVLCPFHGDVNPSLGIVPDTDIFHCFGCGAAGNVIRFHQLFSEVVDGKPRDYQRAAEELCELFDLDPAEVLPTPSERVDTLTAVEIKRAGTVMEFSTHLPRPGAVGYKRAWSSALLEVLPL